MASGNPATKLATAAENSGTTADRRIELCKLRADEYLNRYEKMRDLEWKIVFQIYAGFAAIAVAFTRLADKFHVLPAFAFFSMLATLAFFGAIQYVYFRIQERLIVFNETHEAYVKKINEPKEGKKDETTDAELLGSTHLGQDALGHQYFWTYDSNLVISALACGGMLAYEFFHLAALDAAHHNSIGVNPAPSAWFLWCSLPLTVVIVLFFRGWLAIILGNIRETTTPSGKNRAK